MSQPRHEDAGIASRRLHRIAAILAISLGVIMLLAYALSRTWLDVGLAAPIGNPALSPRLQVDPVADLVAQRAREAALLDGYAWIDRDAGIARIPIDRAMALLVRAHRPTTSQAAGR